ncbi:glycerol-3-phosphate acyltransferase 3-like [Uloborus diversus]|uniref:glycerol-3-phosphate acyltransferase 3-like n=1 Tax=Uloborus diversus TaxID=327109 RepID=UPI002409C823|nr:glycerol-3-phosphate acyltransferase 3-like [Uloborus diversus]
MYSKFCQKKIEKAEKRESIANKDDKEKLETCNNCNSVISREVKLVPEPHPEGCLLPSDISAAPKEFHLKDISDFIKAGVEAVIEDEVTSRFAAEELPAWNLLTRTNKNYQFISLRLTCIWGIGFFLRYCILFPLRCLITFFGVCWLLLCTSIVGCLPEGRFKRWLYWHVSISCFRVFACACSAIVTYHNKENRAVNGGICVANHTSPIDVVILANDNSYALVSQAVISLFVVYFYSSIFRDQTNRYASQTLQPVHLGKRKHVLEWKPCTTEELKRFIALTLLMGHIDKDDICEYWSKDELIETPIFGKSMSRDRYLQILKFLHFANNENSPDQNNPNYDRLWKIREVFDHINLYFRSLYDPTEELSIDEVIGKFKGRVIFKQYIPKKLK